MPEKVPNGLVIDWTKLHLFPDAAGIQHCEVTALRDRYPNWVPGWWRLSETKWLYSWSGPGQNTSSDASPR